MKFVQAQRLLREIKKQRWRHFCFPKKLWVRYREYPDLINEGSFAVVFLYKKRHFEVKLWCKNDEVPEYKHFVQDFFYSYKCLKYKIRKGIKIRSRGFR